MGRGDSSPLSSLCSNTPRGGGIATAPQGHSGLLCLWTTLVGSSFLDGTEISAPTTYGSSPCATPLPHHSSWGALHPTEWALLWAKLPSPFAFPSYCPHVSSVRIYMPLV